MDLLAEIGRDCVGAIQLTRVDEAQPRIQEIASRPLSDSEIGQILDELPRGGPFGDVDFRFSVAGAHEKWALLRHQGRWLEPLNSTPSTHLLKLPVGVLENDVDLSESLENEWLCSRILRAWGTPVATSEILRFGDARALVVERFDRRFSEDMGWIIRLPQEDLAQATGTSPDRKYESDGGPGIRRCLDILLGAADPLSDRRDFFRTQIQFFLLGASDGHAKNFSIFIEAGGRFRLTPRYDVLSAWPVVGQRRGQIPIQKLKLAMALWGKNRHYEWQHIHRRHFEITARECDLHVSGGDLIDDLCRELPSVIDRVKGELPSDFPEHVAESIFDGLVRGAEELSGAVNVPPRRAPVPLSVAAGLPPTSPPPDWSQIAANLKESQIKLYRADALGRWDAARAAGHSPQQAVVDAALEALTSDWLTESEPAEILRLLSRDPDRLGTKLLPLVEAALTGRLRWPKAAMGNLSTLAANIPEALERIVAWIKSGYPHRSHHSVDESIAWSWSTLTYRLALAPLPPRDWLEDLLQRSQSLDIPEARQFRARVTGRET